MRYALPLFALLLLCLVAIPAANAQWKCLYATYDDLDTVGTNATGANTASVAVFSENKFVALATSLNGYCYMIPYRNADSAKGRLYTYGYDGSALPAGYKQMWSDGGFDQVNMLNAWELRLTKDSSIIVANNDPEHNLLVFKWEGDTLNPDVARRTPTGTNGIFGLAIDKDDYIYVVNDTTTGKTDDIKIYKPISTWSVDHNDVPFRTIDLPDGIYKGITVSPSAKSLYVSDYQNRRILKYNGTPSTGYTLDNTFSRQMTALDSLAGATIKPSYIGLNYLASKNILAVCATMFRSSTSYRWSRIYFLNPNTGAMISTDTTVAILDSYLWNMAQTGGYNRRPKGTTPGNASGYASNYDVTFDTKGNLYTISYYGWTVEKWQYNGTLPTIAGVEQMSDETPRSYTLSQNYPNPFNPATTIEFSLTRTSTVSLKVYDVLGREVMTLLDGVRTPGTYKARFDAGSLSSGTYFYTLRAGDFTATKRMVLIK